MATKYVSDNNRRTPRGVRGLKLVVALLILSCYSRTPRGVRGLKLLGGFTKGLVCGSRTPRGVRGLKFQRNQCQLQVKGRTPRGVRGLKFI